MRPDRLKEKIAELIAQPLAEEGANLVDLVVSRYKNNTTVRAFVYTDDGTTIAECTRLSGLIGDLLDGTEWLESGYTLEVSSPGLDRPLTTAQDFKYRVGETVWVDFTDPARKRFQAEIVSAGDENVELKDGDSNVTVRLDEIKKAQIVY